MNQLQLFYFLKQNNCEWFETRSNIPCLSVILRMKAVLKRNLIVVVVD